ncbi:MULTISPECIES: type VII secretion integral membrane protein EccD [unclassified Kitasatospora]|uniref:type VII secretion integral membrane protein EccD n=1 Tax=unclassified Kitasatospora TaxID=2633591 RepID=UPI00070F17A3|nr:MULTISPECIES: type VII secretion integral membrane protein EccD [unclassified Kitasatospora]KQV16151.1 type VII secretion integral membrane protein EccD [Kitasatospora sp. Root107]KRB69627.1 type VII secretion integral membrane protein EccD [Kitasatospora sp. Root187]
MSSNATTGFCRVTVVAPDSRIDVALPEDVPLADIYPEVLRLSGQTQVDGAPTGFHLVRRDGTVLDSGLPLAAQQIRDGDLLSLRPFAESLPPAVYDDVADAIASAVAADRRFWGPELMRSFGLIGAGVLLGLLGFALWFSDLRHDMNGLPGILSGVIAVVLVAFAAVRARVYQDHDAGLALGLGALPHALIAGSGIIAVSTVGDGPGRIQLLVGCVAVLVVSVLLVGMLPEKDSVFVASSFLAAAGTLASFAAVLMSDTSATDIAAVTAVAAVAAIGFLPALSARFARLPVGFNAPGQTSTRSAGYAEEASRSEAVQYERIAHQARRGHEVLVGLVGGCAAVLVGSCAVLGFSDRMWAELLALAVGMTTMLRARLFRYTGQVFALTIAGLAGLALLVIGLSLHTPQFILSAKSDTAVDLRTVWLAASIAAGAAILTGIALVVPKSGVSPFWGRILDMVDSLMLIALVPLALAVLDIYGLVRGATS